MAESSSKWVEKTMGKGKFARIEQFLHFPQFLAPLAEGQRAIVMAWGRRASVRPCVRASVRASVRKLFL